MGAYFLSESWFLSKPYFENCYPKTGLKSPPPPRKKNVRRVRIDLHTSRVWSQWLTSAPSYLMIKIWIQLEILVWDNSIQFNKNYFHGTSVRLTSRVGGGGTLRRNLQPGIPCELNEREFCAGINWKTNTVDIFKEQEILNFISVPVGTTLMTVVFSVRMTKPKMILAKIEQRST